MTRKPKQKIAVDPQRQLELRVSPRITKEKLDELNMIIVDKTKEQNFWFGYAIALRDARMEIAVNLIDLDPNGTKEKLFKKIDKLIEKTLFEGVA
jgi:hypothetical protein